MNLEEQIRKILAEELANPEDTTIPVSKKGSKGIFTNVDAAVAAAKAA